MWRKRGTGGCGGACACATGRVRLWRASREDPPERCLPTSFPSQLLSVRPAATSGNSAVDAKMRFGIRKSHQVHAQLKLAAWPTIPIQRPHNLSVRVTINPSAGLSIADWISPRMARAGQTHPPRTFNMFLRPWDSFPPRAFVRSHGEPPALGQTTRADVFKMDENYTV
ncbi:hypothetical protein IWZ01DRAFT_3693 [Phyllosticta capitalensis]